MTAHEPRTMGTTVRNILNPVNRTGWYALPHVLLVVGVLALTYLAGFFTHAAIKYGASYFAAHYRAPMVVPHVGVTAPALPPVGAPVAQIPQLSVYPGVGDQGPRGACAAWEATWVASYLWRLQHPGSFLRFSPRQAYDHYVDTYSDGQDRGSFPDQDLEISNTTGLLQFKMLPYGYTWYSGGQAQDPFGIDNPIPATDALGHSTALDAAKHRFPMAFYGITPFADNQGPGFHMAVRNAIAAGHPVNLSIQVLPEFDNATQTGGLIEAPQPGESSRGGHEIAGLAYDDNKAFPSGATGGVLIQNQWSALWGDHGRAWMSYAALDAVGFYAEYETMSPPGVAGVHPYNQPTRAGMTFPPPYNPGHAILAGSGILRVHHVRTADTHVDISAAINAASAKYGFSPVGYVALMGTESNINQFAPHTPIPGAGLCDYSAGLVQINVCTAGGYPLHIGDGSSSQANIGYVFSYEQDNPSRAVSVGAKLLAYFKSLVCWNFPELYAAWNEGPGHGCLSAEYRYPSNPVTQQAVYNFAGWMNYAYTNYAYYAPVRPVLTSFQKKVWFEYIDEHHLSRAGLSYQNGKTLTWVGSIYAKLRADRIGGILPSPSWHRGAHCGGYTKTSFQGASIYTWPCYRSYKVVYSHRWAK